MQLAGYEMTWPPDKWTIPKKTRFQSFVKTYESGVFFDWGVFVIGGEVILEWDWLPVEEFDRLQEIYELSALQLWSPGQADRLFHGAVTNGPFTTGSVTGAPSGATATISLVNSDQGYVEVTGRNGLFLRDDVITRGAAYATVETVDIVQNYYVQILDFTGKVFEVVGTDLFYRRSAKMRMLLMSEE